MVQAIENITKKHMLISYREEFHGDAVLELRKNGSPQTCKIEFSLELTPLGSKNIRVQFLENLEYPLIPVIRELKTHITELDRSGRLP
jgi:chitinase